MPTAATTATFAAFAFVLVIVPGPSVLFIIGRGVALGPRVALQTVVGNTIGAVVMVLIVSAGLGPLLDRSKLIFDLIRWFGAAYLIFLGVQAIRRRDTHSADEESLPIPPSRTHIRDGFVVGVTNPKLAVFLAAVLPQFVDTDRDTAVQIAVLGAIFAVVALVCDGAWGVAAGSARHWMGRSPRRLERLTMGGGLLMIAVGIVVAVH